MSVRVETSSSNAAERVVEESLDIPARDGFPLAASLFRPPPPASANGRVVQINGATAVHRRLYARFARFLASRGFVVVTYDYRGTGDSLRVPIRRVRARMRDWGRFDLAGVIDWVEASFADHLHLAVAHSVGGQLLAVTPNVDRLRGIFGVAAQWPSPHHWPVPTRYLLPIFCRLIAPAATHLAGYFPGKLFGMGDLPKGVGLEWMRRCRSGIYMVDDDGRPMRPYADRLVAPVRWIGFADDVRLAPAPAVHAIAEVYRRAEAEVEIYAPAALGVSAVGHWGFFRPWAEDALWRPTAAWLEAVRADA